MPEKKRLLLVNPWIYDFTACDFWLKPLGLLYLASIIKKYTTFELDFLDCLDSRQIAPNYNFKRRVRPDGRSSFYKEEVTKPDLFRPIPRKFSRYGLPWSQVEEWLNRLPSPPEAVLITCTMTYWYPGVQAAIELLRKKFGRVPIILGGIYASLCSDHAQRHSGADLIIKGPGENQILKVLEEIVGTGFIKEREKHISFPSFDSLPSPAYELYKDNEVVCFMTSRGCPFNCSYCASRLLCPKFEPRAPEKVISEIVYFQQYLNPRQVAFYDDALLINKESHLKKILEAIIPLNTGLKFHTPNGLHPKEIDRDLAQLLKRAGFSSLFLSLETADSNLLAQTGPKVSPEDLEKALNNLEEAGYLRSEISVYLLVGLPQQNKTQVMESIEFVQKLGARPRLAYFSPVPGTRDFEALVSAGKLPPDGDPLLHNKLVFPYFWSQITPDDFQEIKNKLIKSYLV
ncbi:MAG: B12-binding domain-containing radical SAM protein [Candidatus Saccharicenans sp.]|nr:radical SAM protein [Candidatus Aminicenantes bacterium]